MTHIPMLDDTYGDTSMHLFNRWRSLSRAAQRALAADFERWQDGDIDDTEFELVLRLFYRRRADHQRQHHAYVKRWDGTPASQRYTRVWR
jgi:hypothetical protein